MKKYRIIRKKNFSEIVIKGKKGQHVNEREVFSINNDDVQKLLKINVDNRKNGFKLIYNITGFVSLKDYLAIPLNKRTFGKMLKQLIEGVKLVKENYLNETLLLLEFDVIMVDPISQNLYFTYVPIQPYENNYSIRLFLGDILKYSVFAPEEDRSYIQKYLEVINNSANFSLFELEQYVMELLEIKSEVKEEIKTESNQDKAFAVYNPIVQSKPGLIRVSTGEKIQMDRACIRIGKDVNENDYCISNNNAISRKHAAFLNEQGSYYVIDLNSTNKTFVNGEVIMPQQKYLLTAGTIIKLGNEEFKFIME